MKNPDSDCDSLGVGLGGSWCVVVGKGGRGQIQYNLYYAVGGREERGRGEEVRNVGLFFFEAYVGNSMHTPGGPASNT